jgi:hypothetical protein
MASGELVRVVAALAALAAGAVAAVVAVLVLHHTAGPVPLTNAPSPAPASRRQSGPAFPKPPRGAVVFSREDGPDALALAVLPGRAQVSVVGQQGVGVDGLDVKVNGAVARSCGRGCYSASAIPPIAVQVGATKWRVSVPQRAPDASALVARATQTWRSLRTLAFSDRLGSDATHVVRSRWIVVAPDELSYTIPGGAQGIVIGNRRWDRSSPTAKWVESPQTATLKQPVPLWQSATDAHIVGQTKTAWRITFFDPGTPAWFEITVERRTFRTRQAQMITTAHFMRERYGPFDAPLAVRPPTSR